MEDTTKLVKAIQVIVQEEVKRQVQKIVKTGIKPIVQEEIERYFGRQKISELKKGGNPRPSSMLDESVVYDSTNYNDTSEWPTMPTTNVGKSISSRVHMEGMEDIMGIAVGANVDLSNPATKAVANAMTRDYSQLMNAMKKG
jgi:hypothetical protein